MIQKRANRAVALKCNYNVITLEDMRIKVIQIGNSKGIRLPKAMIEEIGIEEEVELQRTEDGLLIRPLKDARFGWAEKFRKAFLPDEKADKLWRQSMNKFDEEEWIW
jgi:antitoxin MazE